MPSSSETRRLTPSPPPDTQQEYSRDERSLLLSLAHEAVISALEPLDLHDRAFSQHLSQPRGAFTTLYLHGRLRGCVGYPMPIAPLYRTVMDTARTAAFEDPRFMPVGRVEAHELQISLSVLSAVRPIQAEEIEVGRHGLLISYDVRRGLLLPQVAIEHGWDRITFLEQTCLKAGLPPDVWKKARIEAFTAEVFGDRECES